MTSTGPPMPVPNHNAAKGTQAIGATKRSASNSGDTIASSQRNQPMASPRGMPIATASTNPIPNRVNDDSRGCCSVYPTNGSWVRSTNFAATVHGGGRNWRGASPPSDASVQTPKKTPSPARLSTTNSRRVMTARSRGPPGHRARFEPAERHRHGSPGDRDADHADDDHRREEIESRLIEDVSQANDGPDQLARDERGPACLERETHAGEHQRQRTGKDHFTDQPPPAPADPARRLDETRL